MKYRLEKQNPNDDYAEVVAINFTNGEHQSNGAVLIVLETAKG